MTACCIAVICCCIGPVTVSKMPALHPGDVRKLQAVSVSGLEHLHDVIVFPQQVRVRLATAETRPNPPLVSFSLLQSIVA